MNVYTINVHCDYVYTIEVKASSQEQAIEAAYEKIPDLSEMEFSQFTGACVTDVAEDGVDGKPWDKKDQCERLEDLHDWMQFEDPSVWEECRNLGEIEQVYRFITDEIGVESFSEVKEMIEEEKWDDVVHGVSETEKQVEDFNRRMGHTILYV